MIGHFFKQFRDPRALVVTLIVQMMNDDPDMSRIDKTSIIAKMELEYTSKTGLEKISRYLFAPLTLLWSQLKWNTRTFFHTYMDNLTDNKREWEEIVSIIQFMHRNTSKKYSVEYGDNAQFYIQVIS